MALQDVTVQIPGSSFRATVSVDREVVPSSYAPVRVKGQFTEIPNDADRSQLLVSSPTEETHKMWFCDFKMGYRFKMTEQESLV